MENEQLLSVSEILYETWCAGVPGSADSNASMSGFVLQEQTDEYEIYTADDCFSFIGSFKIKVYRDEKVLPGGVRRLAKSSNKTVNAYGDLVPAMYVYEVVDGLDIYEQAANYEGYPVQPPEDSSDVDDILDSLFPGDVEEKESVTKDSPQDSQLKGFAAVAGMDDLKREMLDEVKWVMDNKEKAEKYGLHVPNGMLLYGYPGCGKTYFAEKLAEELGVTFMFEHGSELGSHYMHETEQNINALFKKAKEQAPCIICIDEIDGFLPYRRGSEGPDGAFLNAEVNEFLSQMNNCGKDGVMVIGTTNNPGLLDPALLRTGRMDKLVYVPLPDEEAREAMLRLQTRRMPCEDGLDYKAVSEACDGMVMSDIECMFHGIAMKCAREDKLLSTEILTTAAKDARRSVRMTKDDDKQDQMSEPRAMKKIAGFSRVS